MARRVDRQVIDGHAVGSSTRAAVDGNGQIVLGLLGICYIHELAKAIRTLQTKYDFQVVLVNQVAADLPTARVVAALCGHGVLLDTSERTVEEIRALISVCDVFIASRFHSCIFALLEGVPTIAVAYLQKTAGIMADLGLSQRVVSIYGLTANELSLRVESDFKNREAVSVQIARAVEQYRTGFREFRDVLAHIKRKRELVGSSVAAESA